MKFFGIFTLFVCCFIITANAQSPSISREVISSGGDYFTSPIGSLSWTLGEPVVETVQNSSINLILTQGFQQPEEIIDTTIFIREIPKSNVFVNLYPNPTASFVRMDLKYDHTSRIRIELVDMLGRIHHADEINVDKNLMSNYQLDVSSLSAGMYMFRLTSEGKLLNTYKFQKTGY